MIRIFLGCTSLISAVIILCTGFIISGLRSVHYSNNVNVGAFRYNLFNISSSWFVVPILLVIIAVLLIYSASNDKN